MEDFEKGTQSLKNLDLFKVKNAIPRASSHDGVVGIHGNCNIHDLPIKVLDKLIANEEKKNQGFSLYNRGDNLRKCLIDANRVKQFI